MSELFEQFLGSDPGSVVELIDDSNTPYRVRSLNGFEYYIGADDFHNYYRKQGKETPAYWRAFITDESTGNVNTLIMQKVMETIKSWEKLLGNWEKARSAAMDAAEVVFSEPKTASEPMRVRLSQKGHSAELLLDKELDKFIKLEKRVLSVLASPTSARTVYLEPGSLQVTYPGPAADKTGKKLESNNTGVKGFRARMKNVEMSIAVDILTIKVDLTKEFGPSKSGKTIIIASSEGNKPIPGREEKIGLNVYKTMEQKGALGQRSSFKNMEMVVQDDLLVVTVDLSKEFGPSKSGKTTIIASSEGNQTILGREEKIGLNVYKKIEGSDG